METVSDSLSNSLHFFRWYGFDVLCVDEFCVTISGKSGDHVDMRVWHAHPSYVSDYPFRTHSLLEGLRDQTDCFEVSSRLRDIPDPAMMILRRDQRVSGI